MNYVYLVMTEDAVVGVFDTEEKATAICRTEHHYIYKFQLNEDLGDADESWPPGAVWSPVWESLEAARWAKSLEELWEKEGISQYKAKVIIERVAA